MIIGYRSRETVLGYSNPRQPHPRIYFYSFFLEKISEFPTQTRRGSDRVGVGPVKCLSLRSNRWCIRSDVLVSSMSYFYKECRSEY